MWGIIFSICYSLFFAYLQILSLGICLAGMKDTVNYHLLHYHGQSEEENSTVWQRFLEVHYLRSTWTEKRHFNGLFFSNFETKNSTARFWRKTIQGSSHRDERLVKNDSAVFSLNSLQFNGRKIIHRLIFPISLASTVYTESQILTQRVRTNATRSHNHTMAATTRLQLSSSIKQKIEQHYNIISSTM